MLRGRPLALSAVWLPHLGIGSLTSSKFQKASSGNSSRHLSQRHSAQQLRGGSSQRPTSSAATSSTWLSSLPLLPAAGVAIASGLALATYQRQKQIDGRNQSEQTSADGQHDKIRGQRGSLTAGGWPKDIAEESGSVRVLTADDLLAQEHPFLEDDHMFSAFVQNGIIYDMEGYYHASRRSFSAIVALGREVAGFPRIVHGGLTAAIFDEAFGGLLFSLKKSRGVRFLGPAYTVQLEVSYKSKIPAGSLILCRAELESFEGRKLWMTAEMRDGPQGKVYATARALFVAPKPQKLLIDVIKYVGQRLGESIQGESSSRGAAQSTAKQAGY